MKRRVMGIEPTQKMKIKRLPEVGGIHQSALEAIGTVIGRELDAYSKDVLETERVL